MEKQKALRFPITKVVIFIAIIAVIELIGNAVQPLVMADISIKAQLADSDASHAGYEIYKQVTTYAPAGYLVLGLLIFRKELKALVKSVLNKGENENNENN